ncbi:MAG: polyphosphate glucokinase [Frankiales bacterium]|nr:polyphosphate glucokinase [Frankiales bacterium]
MTRTGFGIDIGGSGIKGAPVDLGEGRFSAERIRIETPQPATPSAVLAVVQQVLGEHEGPYGVTLPAVVQAGVARSAANIHRTWIGFDAAAALTELTGRRPYVVNDADAAGVAEARMGAARDVAGIVLVLTLGTGIGSALLQDGVLVPNTELGHLELDGHLAEKRAGDAARKADGLDWEQWAGRLTAYLRHLDLLFHPDLIVLGGGVSKKADKFLRYVDVDVEVRKAGLLNDAGIIGAALLAAEDTR